MAQASIQQYSENSNFIDSLEGEEWRPSISYPGVLASSFGRILLPQREARMPAGNIRTYAPKPTYGYVTASSKTAKHTYMGLANRFYGNMKIHRIICEAFHGPRPFEGAVVIHIDENGQNNVATNLKWGPQKDNLNAPKFLEYCRGRTGDKNPMIVGKARKSLNQAGQTAIITEINLGGDQ